MRRSLLAVFSLLLAVTLCNSYKILLYSPTVGHSHVGFFGKIADILLDAGHDVTVFIPLMDPDVQSNGTKRAKVIRHEAVKNLPWAKLGFKTSPFDEDFNLMTFENMNLLQKMQDDVCEAIISNENLLEKLRKEKFDLAMAEPIHLCGYGLFKLLGIPAQIVASAVTFGEGHADLYGIPSPPSYVPSLWNKYSDEMSYTERAINLLSTQFFLRIMDWIIPRQTALFRKYHGEDFPCLIELSAKSALMMVNGDEMFEFPRPISHKVIYIGGVGVSTPKKLEKEMLQIVENSKAGVIYVSFGSVANSTLMPLSKKLAFLEAFASFPEHTFIWKYEEPERDRELFAKYTNVHTVKWAPQIDLLYHKKVLAFLTHCGGNSMTEAIHSGTPMVAIPLFGDQEHNAAIAVKRLIAVKVEKPQINAQSLTAALREVLNDESYTRNARRLAEMIAKKPVKAKDLVVKWTEFAAEFQDLSNLDLAGRNFNFIKYFCLDIFVPPLLVVPCIFIALVKIVQSIRKKLFQKSSNKEKVS
uniref:UDP-glucuronosyltransferase n=1 Tax=Plectus sambesii TaxID=2011161 RepID=A0A914WDV7_9BILA